MKPTADIADAVADLRSTLSPGKGGIGGLLARSHDYSAGNWSTHNFYHADGNGNVTYMLNGSQSMVAEYRYDPFGNLLSSSGSLAGANKYRFSSKEWVEIDSTYGQAIPGLYYYGHRFYVPSLQRWVNRDPIGEPGFQALQRAQSVPPVRNAVSSSSRWINRDSRDNENRYLFIGNNPVTQIDPLGLKIWVCTRPTLISGYILNHAYFWNDQATDPLNQSCGRNQFKGGQPASGKSDDKGPGKDDCREVPGSDGKEDAVMKCCRDKGNTGNFFPFWNDCHKPVKDCLKDNGLSDPGHPYFTPPPPNGEGGYTW